MSGVTPQWTREQLFSCKQILWYFVISPNTNTGSFISSNILVLVVEKLFNMLKVDLCVFIPLILSSSLCVRLPVTVRLSVRPLCILSMYRLAWPRLQTLSLPPTKNTCQSDKYCAPWQINFSPVWWKRQQASKLSPSHTVGRNQLKVHSFYLTL